MPGFPALRRALFSQPGDIFHGGAGRLEHISKLLGGVSHRTAHQLWHIVALQQLAVVVWVLGRQFERLGETTLAVKMGDEWPCEHPVITP